MSGPEFFTTETQRAQRAEKKEGVFRIWFRTLSFPSVSALYALSVVKHPDCPTKGRDS